MKLKNIFFALTVMVIAMLTQAAFADANRAGYITIIDDQPVLIFDEICLSKFNTVDETQSNTSIQEDSLLKEYKLDDLSGYLYQVVDNIKQDLADFAQGLTNEERTIRCGDVTFGLNPDGYQLFVEHQGNKRLLSDHTVQELKDLIGNLAIILPIYIEYKDLEYSILPFEPEITLPVQEEYAIEKEIITQK